jgi:cell division protein FtsB
MRAFAIVLLVVLAGLQYRLWISDDGLRAVMNLRTAVKAQVAENSALARRNEQLVAEVKDLKEGLAALEERARNDLGMIGANETFYQVVEGESATSEGKAPTVTSLTSLAAPPAATLAATPTKASVVAPAPSINPAVAVAVPHTAVVSPPLSGANATPRVAH